LLLSLVSFIVINKVSEKKVNLLFVVCILLWGHKGRLHRAIQYWAALRWYVCQSFSALNVRLNWLISP